DIVAGLRVFAQLSGKKYPQATFIYPDVVGSQLLRSAKKMGLSQENPEFNTIMRGLQAIMSIQRHNRDAAYYGKSVRPRHKERILFRWILDGAQYCVIFGDLHVS